METTSQGTQCSDATFEKVKRYFDMFSENNALLAEDDSEDKNRALLLNHVSLIEDFEREKDAMKTKFMREKEALKRAYENEIKDYQVEIEKLRKIMDHKMDEIESKYKEQLSIRESLQRDALEAERRSLKQSVQEQMDLMAEVESEMKRILKRLLQELKRFEPETCKKLENDLCEKSIKESCVTWLKDIFKTNKVVKIESFKSKGKLEGKNSFDSKQDVDGDELFEVGEAFRKQKKELTEIFMKEKKHLEEQIKNNCLEYKKNLDKEYEERIKSEVNVWQETIKEYEREIGILRYERQQMDRNYCLEIDRLKLETEKEKVEICSKYMKERELLRKSLSDSVMSKMLRETGLNYVANHENE